VTVRGSTSTAYSPPGASDYQRFRHAVGAILHHELFILAAGVAVVVVTLDAPNQLHLWVIW
jgi:putative photosynthetic complex assembly protein 2